MPTEKWRGSLAQAAERLRRTLGWTSAGGINLELPSPVVPLQPVVLTDDATRLGANQYRGRSWMYPSAFDNPQADDWCRTLWHATEGLTGFTVEGIILTCEDEFEIYVNMIPPGETLPSDFTVWSPLVSFSEGCMGINDKAPIGYWVQMLAGVPVGGFGGEVGLARLDVGLNSLPPNNGMPVFIPLSIYIPPGGTLDVRAKAANSDGEISWTLVGKVF